MLRRARGGKGGRPPARGAGGARRPAKLAGVLPAPARPAPAGRRHTTVLFVVMVPYGFRLTDSQVRGELSRGVKKLSEKYTAVIEVDHSYVEQREHS